LAIKKIYFLYLKERERLNVKIMNVHTLYNNLLGVTIILTFWKR